MADSSIILYFEYGLATCIGSCPDWLYSRICAWFGAESHDALRAETSKNLSLNLLKQGYAAMLKFAVDDIAAIRVRTLLVASSVLDNVDATRKMGKILQDNNPKSRASSVQGHVHNWNWRFPELFAKTITAMVNETDLPDGLEELS